MTEKVQAILQKENIAHTITPHKITEIPAITDEDIILVTTKTDTKNEAGIPVMLGAALFTGVDEEAFEKDFLAKVKDIEAAK